MRTLLSHGIVKQFYFIAVMLLLTVAAAAYESPQRSAYSRARSDAHIVALGLRAYAVDHGEFPMEARVGTELLLPIPALTTPVAYLSHPPDDIFKRHRIRDVGVAETILLNPVWAAVAIAVVIYVRKRRSSGPTMAHYMVLVIIILAGCGALLFTPSFNFLSIIKNRAYNDKPHSFYYERLAPDVAILHGVGPDGRLETMELNGDVFNREAFSNSEPGPHIVESGSLSPHQYDITNGIASRGDIIKLLVIGPQPAE